MNIMTSDRHIVCSWCPTEDYIDETEQGQRSHGICDKHADMLRAQRQTERTLSGQSENAGQRREIIVVQ